MTTAAVIFLVVAIVAIAVGSFMYLQLQRTRRLRNRFGAEYERTVEREHGRARQAEALLLKREERVNKLHIRPLSHEDREHFIAEWRTVQERFVDDPRAAVAQADKLVVNAMQARNYPMADFEQRAADISVEYPHLVEHYRVAHDIASRDAHEEVSTEELRRAMQRYRSLFEELAETHQPHSEEVLR
jgi:hypothetical protein